MKNKPDFRRNHFQKTIATKEGVTASKSKNTIAIGKVQTRGLQTNQNQIAKELFFYDEEEIRLNRSRCAEVG